MSAITDKIVSVAKSYIGETELPNNSGWKDAAFQQKMVDCGWQKGQSWCAFTTELIWKEAYGKDSPVYPLLDRLFSASATATAANFIASKDFTTGKSPKEGALVLWRHGTGWQGHAGVVTKVIDGINFKSIEGNTNSAGGREGIEVAEKNRKVGEAFKPNGLNIICFVYPKEVQ